MKKMSMVCVVFMCLVRGGVASRVICDLEIYLDGFTEERVAQIREELKDKSKLRRCTASIVSSHLSEVTPERVEAFKQKYGVGDDAMLTELMDIIREGAVKAGWTKYRKGDAKDTYVSVKGHLRNAIFWLNLLSGADAEIKPLMMDIATDGAVADEYRSAAIHTYLRRANAREVQEAVVRFLSDDMRMTENFYRLYVYHAIIQVSDVSEKPSDYWASR